MASLSISRAWDDSRRIIARDGKLLISVALALIVLPVAVLGLLAPPLSTEVVGSWVNLVSMAVALVGIAGQIALVRLALASPMVVRDAIAHAFKRLLPTFVALVLFAFALALLLTPLFLILAGPEIFEAAAAGTLTEGAGRAAFILVLVVIAIVARFQLITPVGSAEATGPFGILKRSWQLSKGNYWRLLAFIILTLVLALIVVLYLGQVMGALLIRTVVGEIAPYSLGALLAGLISGLAQGAFSIGISVMLARIYAQLASPEASVPQSG